MGARDALYVARAMKCRKMGVGISQYNAEHALGLRDVCLIVRKDTEIQSGACQF
ncbi:hypothetical protein KBA01_05510 [Kozakia baliensis]|nr:hypothetical protein KBA01_05510 [Kozakia baliensis]